MVAAMVLGGLRRCEVLGLRMQDVRVAERRLFVADGKGGHQRLVPVSSRFFTELARYLEAERRARGTDRVFVVLKGPNRGNACVSGESTRCWLVRGGGQGWRTGPVMRCGTPA